MGIDRRDNRSVTPANVQPAALTPKTMVIICPYCEYEITIKD
jgi:hypothetical protein